MDFPVMILGIHPHLLFEGLGYLAGMLAMLWASSKGKDTIDPEQRHPLIVAGLLGAILGAKILAWAQHPQTTLLIATDEPALLLGGKTIVGGLLGGMVGIELAKRAMGITKRTGDVLVLPLILGMTLGRIGCFLTGLDDSTYGIETSLFWGIDLGDGISRHPTALYEIVALWSIYFGIKYRVKSSFVPSGWQFRTFLMSYLVWRLLVDWIKPTDWELLFFSPIQLACILGLSWYLTLGVLSEEEWATGHS